MILAKYPGNIRETYPVVLKHDPFPESELAELTNVSSLSQDDSFRDSTVQLEDVMCHVRVNIRLKLLNVA